MTYWQQVLTKPKCILIDNVAIDLWPQALSHLHYLTNTHTVHLEGSRCNLGRVLLFVERNNCQSWSPS
jgi:hypothetical protein